MKTISYPDAYRAYQEGTLSAYELTAWYIIEGLQQKVGNKWLQGRRAKVFPSSDSVLMKQLGEHRLYQFPELASRSLCAWSLGERKVALLFEMPTTLDILRMQSRGERCVSLIEEDKIPKEYEGRADFVSHDLCHLEKFYDPNEYRAQTGFFSCLLRLVENPQWQSLVASLDVQWQKEFARVAADMNGSPIFLWAAFKASLRPALHRMENPGASFDPHHWSSFVGDTFSQVCDWFGLSGSIKDDAIRIGSRNEHYEESLRLHAYFSQHNP